VDFHLNFFNAQVGNDAFDQAQIEMLSGRRILITGAGGSIGSAIVKVLSVLSDVVFMATDHDEGRLHSLSLDLDALNPFPQGRFSILDIKDPKSIQTAFDSFEPTDIIHAAALKHLKVLEVQPREALTTNILGTKNLIDISMRNDINNFVNISTDKAAEPTSVLGRSKFLAELITAKASKDSGRNYVSCRFGNVFASRGSVIETFESQIKHGGPLTLSSKEVSRYFMSARQAAYLSVCSLLMNSHSLYIFDMGEPISLLEVAEKMISESNANIEIIEIGLSSGEKKHEILSSQTEELIKTTNSKIFGANFRDESSLDKELLSNLNPVNEIMLLQYLQGQTT